MALNIENIIAEIKEASILELNDLVKAIEEEFGVTAAAPVAVAAVGAADAGAAKDSFDVELTFSGGKMTKELQSSRYIVISFLVREMGIDIVEAISLMAELEKSGLVRLESSGDLILKELGGAL